MILKMINYWLIIGKLRNVLADCEVVFYSDQACNSVCFREQVKLKHDFLGIFYFFDYHILWGYAIFHNGKLFMKQKFMTPRMLGDAMFEVDFLEDYRGHCRVSP